MKPRNSYRRHYPLDGGEGALVLYHRLYRDAFEDAYGLPTDIDKVWAERDAEQVRRFK